MKGLLVVLALLVVSGVVGLAVTRAMAGRGILTGASPHWQIRERRRRGGRLVVELLPPAGSGHGTVVVADLDAEADGIGDALDDARIEAVRRLRELESGRPA